MSNVIIDKNKIDILANAIAVKSGEPVTMTLAEMVEAVDEIVRPEGTINITHSGDTDVTAYETATVSQGSATPLPSIDAPLATVSTGTNKVTFSKTIPNAPVVTPGYISSGTSGNTNISLTANINTRNSSSLTASGATVTAPYGYYSSAATKTIASGSATPASSISGTNATVSSPSSNKIKLTQTVSSTPQVTAGYISSGTSGNSSVSLTGACMTQGTTTYYPTTSDQSISTGTFLTGTQTIKAVSQTNLEAGNIKNGTTISISNGNGNIWSVTGTYGGGGSSIQVDSMVMESYTSNTMVFGNLLGEPTSFVITCPDTLSPSATPTVASVFNDGTNTFGQKITNTNNAQVSYDDTSYSFVYNNGTLTVSTGSLYIEEALYTLVYTYGGSSANIATDEVQVGSGATSISFTDIPYEPMYFSLAFKSDFGTSSGYQRVIDVVYDGANTYGNEMDSSAKYSNSHWSYTYNAGTLTISSSGTNAGGYFHQPGNYQLTYAYDANAPQYQAKTATPSATAQEISADNGYAGLSKVNVEAVVCSNLTASNIVSGVTVKIGTATDDDSVASVTGTASGGGSKNVQTAQGTSRTSATSLTSVTSLTCSTAGTYDVYYTCTRSSTSGTWSSRLYVGGTASGDEQTTWSNHVQTVHLSNVSINANQTVAVYVKTRGTNYYGYAPQLTIVQA